MMFVLQTDRPVVIGWRLSANQYGTFRDAEAMWSSYVVLPR